LRVGFFGVKEIRPKYIPTKNPLEKKPWVVGLGFHDVDDDARDEEACAVPVSFELDKTSKRVFGIN